MHTQTNILSKFLVLFCCFGFLGSLSASEPDFGDFTSETLTTKAWFALEAGNYDEVLIYTRKSIELYAKEATKMQASLTQYAPKEEAFNYWALNDVGTCYFIMGEALISQKDYAGALKAYNTLIENYGFSQCWDPKGWFWKPAVAARGKLNKIKAEHPDLIAAD